MDSRKLTFRIASVVAGIAVVGLSLWYGANNGLLPDQATEEARMIDQLFRVMLVISTGIFLLVQGIILYSVFAFGHKKEDATDALPIHGDVGLEVFWTAVPAAIVLWISVYSYDVSSKISAGGSGGLGCTVDCPMISPAAAITGKEMVIEVLAQQYAWSYKYPGFNTQDEQYEMHVPLGQTVILSMQAKDVIHAFWVPEFRLKQDIIPGRVTRLKFTATKPGTYALVCAELCGVAHGGMRSTVIVQPQKEFDAWAKTDLGGRMASRTVDSNKLALK